MQVAIPGKPIPINMDAVLYKEVEMRTSFASELTSWKIGLNLLEQGKVKLDDLASYILPLSEWEDGFNKTINKEAFKVVLRPNMD